MCNNSHKCDIINTIYISAILVFISIVIIIVNIILILLLIKNCVNNTN